MRLDARDQKGQLDDWSALKQGETCLSESRTKKKLPGQNN
jgi:hypothetical protein